MFSGAFKSARKLASKEDGSSTIEAVIWFPIFVGFFLMVADVALIFHGQAQMLRIAQDANRLYSVGRLPDEAATAAYVVNRLAQMGKPATAETVLSGDDVITTTVHVRTGDIDAVGVIEMLTDIELTITSQHVKEV